MNRTIETILRKLIIMALQLCLPLIPKSYACPKWCGHRREEMGLRLRCALSVWVLTQYVQVPLWSPTSCTHMDTCMHGQKVVCG